MRFICALLILATAFLAPRLRAAEDMEPAHRAAVLALVDAQEMDRIARNFLERLAHAAPEQLRQREREAVLGRGDMDAERKARAIAAIDATAADMARDMAQEFARLDLNVIANDIGFRVYAPRFSTQELTDLAAFYSTPLGKKMIRAGAEIAVDSSGGGFDGGSVRFTPEELREIKRFNETPAARHVLSPEVQHEMQATILPYLAPARTRIQAKYRPRFQALASP